MGSVHSDQEGRKPEKGMQSEESLQVLCVLSGCPKEERDTAGKSKDLTSGKQKNFLKEHKIGSTRDSEKYKWFTQSQEVQEIPRLINWCI